MKEDDFNIQNIKNDIED